MACLGTMSDAITCDQNISIIGLHTIISRSQLLEFNFYGANYETMNAHLIIIIRLYNNYIPYTMVFKDKLLTESHNVSNIFK